MNDALEYMEDNLDGEISVEQATRLACCSQFQFQKMFSFIIRVSLSEYLRRRRLTKAALDMQNGDKVIDVALHRGYDSPTARPCLVDYNTVAAHVQVCSALQTLLTVRLVFAARLLNNRTP